MKEVLELLGVEDEASAVEAIKELQGKAELSAKLEEEKTELSTAVESHEGEIKSRDEKIEGLETELSAVHKKHREEFVDGLITEGKLTPDQRDSALSLVESNDEDARKILLSISVGVGEEVKPPVKDEKEEIAQEIERIKNA